MTRSNLKFSALLVLAFAGLSSFSGGNCTDGFCQLSGVSAQVNRGPVATKRDPILEKESLHHLDVAWQYFKKKPDKSDPNAATRLNKAIADRLNEIIDTNPDFAKMDEVNYLLGEVYHRLDDNDKAIHYLDKVVKEAPDSKYFREAKKRLEELQASAANKDKKEGKEKH